MNGFMQNSEIGVVKRGWRPRFRLRTLALVLALLAVLLAMNVSTGPPKLMVQSIYGYHYGWPLTYLRVPTGEHAHIPLDLFVPGLLVNFAAAFFLLAGVIVVWRRFGHVRRQDVLVKAPDMCPK